MGTSGAYTGSGGQDFQNARANISRALNAPGPDKQRHAQRALEQLADAVGWAGTVGLGRTGHGGGGGTGTTQTGGLTGGGRAAGHVGRVSGPALAAAYAVGSGDAAALSALGLDLAELRGLSPMKQCRRILREFVPSDGSIEDEEIRAATSRAILDILNAGEDVSAEQVVRIMVRSYVYEVALTEFGDKLRDGARDGRDSIVDERSLRDLIDVSVDRIDLPSEVVGAAQFENAVATSLGRVRRVFGGAS